MHPPCLTSPPYHLSHFHFHQLRLLYELHFMKMQLPVRRCHCRRRSSRYHCRSRNRSRSHCSCCCLCRCIAPPFRVHCKYFIIAKFCQLIPCACESCCELGVSRFASACRTLPADRRRAARQQEGCEQAKIIFRCNCSCFALFVFLFVLVCFFCVLFFFLVFPSFLVLFVGSFSWNYVLCATEFHSGSSSGGNNNNDNNKNLSQKTCFRLLLFLRLLPANLPCAALPVSSTCFCCRCSWYCCCYGH